MRTILLRALARFARQLALTSPVPFPFLPGTFPHPLAAADAERG
ncbi:hypothetical protein [Kitasatospora sp. NPDC058218]